MAGCDGEKFGANNQDLALGWKRAFDIPGSASVPLLVGQVVQPVAVVAELGGLAGRPAWRGGVWSGASPAVAARRSGILIEAPRGAILVRVLLPSINSAYTIAGITNARTATNIANLATVTPLYTRSGEVPISGVTNTGCTAVVETFDIPSANLPTPLATLSVLTNGDFPWRMTELPIPSGMCVWVTGGSDNTALGFQLQVDEVHNWIGM